MKNFWCALAVLLFPAFLSAQFNCIKGDCRNGQGTCVFSNGGKYVGEFKDGRLHGKGIFYFADGNKYIGNWDNQLREGDGRMVFSSGDEYFGEFRRNKFSGRGVMTYVSGNRYEGYWQDNKPHGQGTFSYANGERYEGNFKEGQFDGQGKMTYADGSVYEGEWRQQQRHGSGALSYPDGQKVSGQWNAGNYQADWTTLALTGDTTNLRNCNAQHCANGKGKYTYRDGSRYVGTFFNGVPEGEGAMYYATGDRYEGAWKQNAPHGRGVMYYRDGKVLGAIWEYGKAVKKLFNDERPVVSTPVTIDKDPAVKVWAVIVGAARYTHMPVLRYTDDDAYQIYAFFKSPEGGALPDNQIKVLIDEDATLANITSTMRSVFLRADDNDVVLFYFSGHGIQGAFLPIDYDGANNILEHKDITDLLKRSQAKHKIVFADACHSGSLLAARGAVNAALKRYYDAFESTAGGTALFMSSKGEEYSLEDGGLRSGIFSHFVVRGLKGEADTNGDKVIGIQELFDYVYRHVRTYTGNIQTPTLSGTFDARMPVGVIRN